MMGAVGGCFGCHGLMQDWYSEEERRIFFTKGRDLLFGKHREKGTEWDRIYAFSKQ